MDEARTASERAMAPSFLHVLFLFLNILLIPCVVTNLYLLAIVRQENHYVRPFGFRDHIDTDQFGPAT
jgi:hypothetical protein